MPILIVVVLALGGALWWWIRSNPRDALSLADDALTLVRNAPRRIAFRRQTKEHAVEGIDDPRLAIATIAHGLHRAGRPAHARPARCPEGCAGPHLDPDQRRVRGDRHIVALVDGPVRRRAADRRPCRPPLVEDRPRCVLAHAGHTHVRGRWRRPDRKPDRRGRGSADRPAPPLTWPESRARFGVARARS